MIFFKCSECGKFIEVGEELAGKETECPFCRAAQNVPTTSDATLSRAGMSDSEVSSVSIAGHRVLGSIILFNAIAYAIYRAISTVVAAVKLRLPLTEYILDLYFRFAFTLLAGLFFYVLCRWLGTRLEYARRSRRMLERINDTLFDISRKTN